MLDRSLHEIPSGVEQAVVEAPGGYPDRRHGADLHGELQAAAHLDNEALPIPAQVTIGASHRVVLVPVDHVEPGERASERDTAHTDRVGSEVDCYGLRTHELARSEVLAAN